MILSRMSTNDDEPAKGLTKVIPTEYQQNSYVRDNGCFCLVHGTS